MRALAVVTALASGCGRIGFAALTPGDDGSLLAIPPGARIWLKMDSDPAVAIIDSGGGHAVSCVGSCPQRVAGLHDGAYLFTTAETLDITYAADLDASAGFTAALWVWIAANPTVEVPAFHIRFNDAMRWDMFVIGLEPTGTSFFDGESATGVADNEFGPTLPLNTWQHLAFSWDGSTKRIYQDGTLLTTRPIVTTSGTDDPIAGGIAGEIDDLVFYTRVLTQGEVSQLATP
jgi:hypothetical protein